MALRVTQTVAVVLLLALVALQQHQIMRQGEEIIKDRQQVVELNQVFNEFAKDTNSSIRNELESIKLLGEATENHTKSINILARYIQ